MKCPNCRNENPEDAIFCNKCATKLELKCPSCGKHNPPDSLFCNKCASSLGESEKDLSIDYSEPQSYTPKYLADKILTTRSAIEGERKLVTVFFCDIADYTSMSEKLDPEEVHQIMDGCFRILMDEIHKYEGTINQFTGDGVMALFGAPVSHEDHAQRACYAALKVQETMIDYGEKIHKDTGLKFKMRVGLNSGPVIVGSIGDDLRMDYTAIGDTVNLASRMESSARPGFTMVTADTYRIARNYFEFKSLGEIDVKGKEEPQKVYELIKPSDIETRIEASIAKGLTPFVGRKNSMATLMELYDKARLGSGQVIGIVGEAGVGKSRLLLEFRNQLPIGEFTYLEGHCLHYGSSISYLPILDVLKSYYDIKDEDREYITKKKLKDKMLALDEKLDNVISPIQEILSLKVEDKDYKELAPKDKREKTFEALRDLYIIESQNKPLILAIEDLQWIDKTSNEFIDYLIGWLTRSNILLILLYRPEYVHPWGNKSYYTQIGLNQLEVSSSTELLQAILEDGMVESGLRNFILKKASGNPLFMEELTYSLIENKFIEKKGQTYLLIGKESEIQVPDTIHGIISARMDRLEDNLKRIMQVSSVIGRDFTFRILQAISEMKEGLKSYLLNLQELEFIYEKNLFPELEYIFKHALIQDVAYNSLLLRRRKELHEKIGNAIEEIYKERLEEFYEVLAYHYLESGNTDKAYQYLKLSGNKASQHFANHESYNFYFKALEVLKQLPDSSEKIFKELEIIVLISNPMSLLSFPEGSLEILQTGEKLAKELKDTNALLLFYSFISFYYSFNTDFRVRPNFKPRA